MRKFRDLICSIIFILAFIFVGSGMLEACVLALLGLAGK